MKTITLIHKKNSFITYLKCILFSLRALLIHMKKADEQSIAKSNNEQNNALASTM